jgi:hypothetical protein
MRAGWRRRGRRRGGLLPSVDHVTCDVADQEQYRQTEGEPIHTRLHGIGFAGAPGIVSIHEIP